MLSEPTTTSILLLAGLISGFCSSAPLGPINLWLVEAVIENSKKNLLWFLMGVIIVDLTFAYIAVWGYSEYLQDSTYMTKAQIVAGIFLVVIGLVNFQKLMKQKRNVRDQALLADQVCDVPTHRQIEAIKEKPFKNFLLGASLCGSNPGFLMFWLFVVNFINDTSDLSMTVTSHILFLLGVAIGDGLWFGLLAKIVSKGINLAKPSILLMIRYGIALSFLICGSVAIWRSF